MALLARTVAAIGLLAGAGIAVASPDTPLVDEGWIAVPEGPPDAMSEAARQEIWRTLEREQARLALPKAGAHPLFRWPLRAARGYSDPIFSRVINHVDHDPAFPDRLRDYACGTLTYDRPDGYNHAGTDIGIFPDQWNLMIAGQIEIVAAAPGTIIFKADGNFDRSCARNIGADWNAVYVQHDDGSVAWYGHMKSGSPTPKRIGERVVAGEYLGLVGASGNASVPHLHLEVYDANRRLVDPFQGACNDFNADSWWEAQPAYQSTQVMSVLTASASPTAATCGADGRLQDPGSVHRKSAFARGDVAYFVASVRDLPAGGHVHYEIRDPTGALWFQFDNSPATDAFFASTWWGSLRLASNAPIGTWMVEASLGTSVAQAPFTVTADGAAIPNYTDLWWNGAESGWGVNIDHQGDTIFATWFTYDSDGAGLWLVMPAGAREAGGGFAGALYRTTGVPFAQIAGRPATSGAPTPVGSGRFRFPDADHALFSYTVNGITQEKALQRQRFSTAPACIATRGTRVYATNYQDLWWNPAESGWGINVAHQGDTVFATWFTYGAGGRGIWLVAPDARRQPTGEFRGRLYRTAGIAFDRIAGAPAMTGNPVDVGELALAFADGENGRLDYSVDGVAQSKAITRQVFAAGTPLCR